MNVASKRKKYWQVLEILGMLISLDSELKVSCSCLKSKCPNYCNLCTKQWFFLPPEISNSSLTIEAASPLSTSKPNSVCSWFLSQSIKSYKTTSALLTAKWIMQWDQNTSRLHGVSKLCLFHHTLEPSEVCITSFECTLSE